jgi:two-component system, OmpR family, sensor histidine kinase ChvG
MRIRTQLVALALLLGIALVALAALTGSRLERFFKEEQAQAVALSARAVAAALSDRPHLFARSEANAAEEERRRILALFAAGDPDQIAALGEAYVPAPEAENIVSLASRQAARVWVVDPSRTVRALTGSLKQRATPGNDRYAAAGAIADGVMDKTLRPLLRALSRAGGLPQGEVVSRDTQLDRALDGRPTVERRQERGAVIVAAAQSVFAGDRIVAAVLVEESTDALADARTTTLESMLLLAGAALVLTALVMFAFATRLARRIVHLARAADAAIDPQGRVQGVLQLTNERDEVGQLRHSLAAMLTRLARYNAYLEALAGRLAHELRTPLAVVRSSLDNLRLTTANPAASVYVDRAGSGVERLAALIGRLSEATRLEQFLATAQPQAFDIAAWARDIGGAYQQVYPHHSVVVHAPVGALSFRGVADALAQLVDKLMENAVSFTPAGGKIELQVNTLPGGKVEVRVSNDGPTLPAGMEQQLFSSMVSVRHGETQASDRPRVHLGLGLYIVRIVAEFHRGTAVARNRSDGSGVEFSVTLG